MKDPKEKKIKIDTPAGGVDIDTGNKWLDAGIVLVVAVVAVIGLVVYFK